MSSETTYKKAAIYTKTGDKGLTSLYNGERHPKNSNFFEVVGTLDELSSVIGMYYLEVSSNISEENEHEINDMMTWIQSRLLDLGSHVATPVQTTTSDKKLEQTKFESSNVKVLEDWIDKYDSLLPKLKNFILPNGALHLARSVCRRAERQMVQLLEEGNISKDSFIFVNRLSDFLFTIARYVSLTIYKKPEIVYKKI